MADDDTRELQEGEIEVLKSIFMEDFETVVSTTAWKSVNAAHEFRVCVRPQEEELKDSVSVRIHFKLPALYPKKPPTMTFEEPKGLSQAHLNALRTSLQQSATSLLGAEMIYELCTNAAQFITDRHQDMERGKQTSLEDQRRKRGQEEEKATREANARAEALKARLEAAEAARLSQLISEDVRRKEELRAERVKQEREREKEGRVEFLQVDSNGDRKLSMSLKVADEEKEATVKLGLMAGGDWIGRQLPAEIAFGVHAALAGSAYVADILAPYFLTSHGKRKVGKIESDLDRVRAIRHPHILSLYGSRLTRYTSSFFPGNPHAHPAIRSTEGWSLIVLSEVNPGQSLEDLLGTIGELRPERAITYFTQLVSAVECLHAANIIHKSIKPRAVSLGKTGVGVKLGEVAWFQRLVDLNKAEQWVVPSLDHDLPDSWICPEVVEEPFLYDRNRDMWDLGVVFAQMVFGLDVFRRYASPADLVRAIPRNSAPVIRKVLNDLLLTEGKKRVTAARLSAQLVETSSSGQTESLVLSTTPKNSGWQHMKTGGPNTPLFSPAPPTNNVNELSKSFEKQVGFFWQPRPSGSRYRSEFEELEFLGKGGGGQVVKARNRLDGHLYAVKKIKLPHDRASEVKILREVTIWSRMNHPNIVRYHTAWTETTETEDPANAFSEVDTSTQPSGNTLATSTDDSQDDTSDDDGPSEFDSDSDSSVRPGDELDMDLGLDDLDDEDFLSVGHSKSVSYPSIHFGNEGDASTNGQTSPVMSKPTSRISSPVVVSSPKQTRTLYIQMEYVEKLTLREAIEDGITEVDAWRLMFQILSAMLHFTSLNIIHRDLKPSNIFIDRKGDVRIGDFGLAVNQGAADPQDVFLSVDSSMEEGDLTSGVGTSLYIAPETLSRGRVERSVKYSNKIDMYSLGIVFFEMFHPAFKTGMERIHVLRALREPQVKFPPTWDAVKLARHTKIIQTCLVHDPERRASPKDLLASDLLPPRVGDDSIEETIRLLSHSGTPHAQTLITALFNQTDEDRLRKDFSYDFYDGQGAKVDNDPYAELVREKLSRIFRAKGAALLDSPLLMPHSQIYASRKPVRLLDADGTIACLPFLLNIPFCRMVARDTSLTRLKRWTIAPVYRSSTAGGQPRAVLNAAFDIVTDAVTAAAEAEVILVVEEIMAAFPLGETMHIINHSKLLDVLVERIPAKRRPAALEVLVQHGRLQRTWFKTSTELMKLPGVTRAMCDEMALVDTTGDVASMRSLFLSSIPPMKHLVQEAFDELQEIVAISQQLGVKNIKVAPLLATNWDFHRDGAIFESHHLRGKTRDVIAAGGRFDDVVSRLAAPEVRFSGRCPHVVGVSIAVAKLSQAAADANVAMTKHIASKKDDAAARSYGPWAVRRCDVYVVSFAATLIELRLDIVKDLWKAGIRADIMYDDDFLTLTPEQLVSACRREGIMWIVIVKQGPGGRAALDEPEKTLKVKSVLRGYEEEVPRSELVSWLSKEMREVDEAAGEAVADSVAAHTDAQKTAQDYIPIILDDDVRQKGRAKQKQMMITRAQTNVEKTAEAAASAPVFAIDVDGAVFRKMCESAAWITDDEAFRAITSNAPPAKRVYLTSIRQNIIKYKNRANSFASFWLFSLRGDRSVLLTMPES
ncbi:kinase-like domain-containing protein [Leucosporidium creatinivorum]|uniref:non-specific serine/threonine protein kinase n=1 Tax=Leucosporidium creatinivorum TaxID=106004 RepID=A0A1Y2FRY9_9BASI|nr:kinase-like domain-containing protein [Leucosporidium creatinivorum]